MFTTLQKEYIQAVGKNDIAAVKELLKNSELNPNIVLKKICPGIVHYDQSGQQWQIDSPRQYHYSIASHALQQGYIEMANLLLEHGVYLSGFDRRRLEEFNEIKRVSEMMSLNYYSR